MERHMDRGITLKDIARELNVSITTVSKAINNHPDISEKRKKEILDYAKRYNYVPNEIAKSFRQQRSSLVGIILPDNSNPYNARVLRGIEACLYDRGYHCMIMNSNENVEREMQAVKELSGMNIAGVLLSPALGNRESCDYLDGANIPYVLVNRYLDKGKNAYVVIDDEQAAYSATNYLATYRHERIFFLNYLPGISTTEARLRGYRKSLAENQITFASENVIDSCMNHTDGYAAIVKILGWCAPPFSVLCYSDYIAIGVLCALQERGFQSPVDVPVMGNDDIEILSFVKPRLSTVAVPKYRLGYQCVEMLIDLINRKQASLPLDEAYLSAKQIVKKTELIIRETC